MSSSRSGARPLSIAAGALLGGAFALIGTALIAGQLAIRDGPSALPALGPVLLTYGSLPALLAGAVVGGLITRWGAHHLETASPTREWAARPPRHLLGVAAALLFGYWTAVFLMPLAAWGGRLLRAYVGLGPTLGRLAPLLVYAAALVAIWQIALGVGRRVNEAVAPREGQPRFFDLAILAIAAGLFGLVFVAFGVELLLNSPMLKVENPHVHWNAAHALASGAMYGAAAHALLRRRRALGNRLLLALAIWQIGSDLLGYVLAPDEKMQQGLWAAYRQSVATAALLIGILLYVRWRLPAGTPAAGTPTATAG